MSKDPKIGEAAEPREDNAASAEASKAAGSITRRQLLRAGAGVAAVLSGGAQVAAALAAGESNDTAPQAGSRQASRLPKTPNIIVLMTDQERHMMHWPQGWAEKNLPALARLKRNGLYFKRAYTAATQCSPSRAVMLTSRFAPVNRVTSTFLWPGLQHYQRQPNIASLLKAKAGYEVVWKGKWHLSFAANAAPGNGGQEWTAADIKVMEENFGWSAWNPPDAGNAIEEWQTDVFGKYNGLATLGGGNPNNDRRYLVGVDPNASGQTQGVGESVVEFLKNRAPKLGKPFCMFISLVNPHDVYVYPTMWKKAGYDRDAFADLGIELPPNYDDDLSKKPSIQKAARAAYNKFAPLDNQQALRDYVNFYAYLQTVVDKHVMLVLDTLEETGLMDDTIILRLADHGEGGLSHGMREKAYTVYEEMVHIPLIVHNRRLYPEPMETDAFYDHLNLLPTILDLAGVPKANSYGLGNSIAPVMKDPSRTVQDHTVFSFDDRFFLPAGTPGGHLRAIREGDWTYAVYFGLDGSGLEYELYNIKNDPGQLDNLLYATPAADLRKEWARLHKLLTNRFVDAGNLPNEFAWPIEPATA
ncbi:MAG: sulfatase-like hydrolase/transferase [Candidatus Binataceae bacterium]